MVETEPTGYKENMRRKGRREEIMRKRLTVSIKSFTSGTVTFVSLPTVTGHGKYSRRSQELQIKALGTLLFSAHPSDVVSCATTNFQVFGMNCLKLEEF